MAPGLEEELSCPVCKEIFSDPVFLWCSHSFCKKCLKRWWRKKKIRECPVCKAHSGSTRPCSNLVLRNTCEAFQREKSQKVGSEEICDLHSEQLKLFCVDHQQPVCLICRDSEIHSQHRFRPIIEMVEDHKAKLEDTLSFLQEKLKLFRQAKEDCDQTAEHIQVQVRRTEMEIRWQFKKLHLFLQEEEDHRIAALREEEEQKSQMIKEKLEAVNRAIAGLADRARATEEKLNAVDASFLQSCRTEAESSAAAVDCPQLPPGALVDEAKHVGNLTFYTWNKMKNVVSYSPVVLDPNTAEAGLILSEDLMSAECGERQKLPENPERFDCHGMILASEGFVSGTHRWAVEVGDNSAWFVGVAAGTFRRKGRTDIRSGLWAVAFSKGEYVIISPPDTSPVHCEKKLKVISVQLDCERGTVSFFNAETNTHIYSLAHTCSEMLFPVFYTGSGVPLRILPAMLNDGGDDSSDDGAQADHDEGGSDVLDVDTSEQ